MNLIFKHPSGGELWQGSIYDANKLLSQKHDRIRTIGLFAQELQPDKTTHPHYELLCFGFADNFMAGRSEIDQIKKIADQASDHFAKRIRRGVGVLSSCHMGLNRSGLVSAMTLIKLGVSPTSAVRLIRNARGPRALSNPMFAQVALSS